MGQNRTLNTLSVVDTVSNILILFVYLMFCLFHFRFLGRNHPLLFFGYDPPAVCKTKEWYNKLCYRKHNRNYYIGFLQTTHTHALTVTLKRCSSRHLVPFLSLNGTRWLRSLPSSCCPLLFASTMLRQQFKVQLLHPLPVLRPPGPSPLALQPANIPTRASVSRSLPPPYCGHYRTHPYQSTTERNRVR